MPACCPFPVPSARKPLCQSTRGSNAWHPSCPPSNAVDVSPMHGHCQLLAVSMQGGGCAGGNGLRRRGPRAARPYVSGIEPRAAASRQRGALEIAATTWPPGKS
eukprot:356034-Chlamydomonas_euryale.AAC.7